jgi:hypothetical protein
VLLTTDALYKNQEEHYQKKSFKEELDEILD